jgi:uncharacterized protein YecT (DUF1311 family)
MKKLIFAVTIALCGSTIAVAQDIRGFELSATDGRLNEIYGQIISRLRESDRQTFRKSQRLWISFRDADCAVGWANKLDCLIERTDQRVEQLRSTYYFDKNGVYFSLAE